MATLTDLVRTVAAVEGLDETSVGIYARAAREAGLISQSGRGRSAASMQARDAANLLIAVNACPLAKDVAVLVPIIRELPVDRSEFLNVLHRVAPTLHTLTKFGQFIDEVIAISMPENETSMLDKILQDTISVDDRRKAARYNIKMEHVSFDMVFKRPRPVVEIIVRVPRIQKSRNEKPWAYFWEREILIYKDYRSKEVRGDRTDAASITNKTFSAVVETLAR